MKEALQSAVLCFSGRIASGKSEVSKAVARQLHVRRVSFGDYIRQVARYMGLDTADRQLLQDIGKLYAEHPREFCGKLLEQVGYKNGAPLVIDGVRHERIVDELRAQVAPAELILIYIEADEATIERRLQHSRPRQGGYTERIIDRLENDSTEAEVLHTLPGLADLKIRTDDLGGAESAAQKIVEWLRDNSITERAKGSDEKIVVSKFEYERLKEERKQMRYALLDSWLNEPGTKERLQRCADFAVGVLHNDQTLRVPRSPEQRENGFARWRNAWRDRLGTEIQGELSTQFPDIASPLSPDTIRETVMEYLWPQIETEFLAFALEGLARTWVRRHMGDATIIGRPTKEGARWVVPLGIEGHGTNLGQVILDRDGNVLEEASSSRKDLLAQIQ